MTTITSPLAAATAQATAPVEPAIEAQAAAPVVEEQLSPKFAALAKKERLLRQQQQAIAAEKVALQAEREKYKTDYVPKSEITADTWGTLSKLGITQEQLMQLALNQGTPQEQTIKQLQDKLAALEEKQTKTLTTLEEQNKKQYEQALNQIRNEAKVLVDGNAEFETIKSLGAEEAVVELIKQTFDADGTLLTVEDAARQVEEHLLEEAVKMASLGKVKAKLTPTEAAQPGVEQKLPQAQLKSPPAQMRTLTNAATVVSSKPLSAKDRRERAILAFKGQLTS